MGQSPFAKRPVSQESVLGRRRSTRVEFVTRVILTGRDASGKPFREETETSSVNLHGAKLRTHQRVLVGMQVGVESLRCGLAEKAICVWVSETPPGQTTHDIAIQLFNPGNIWGLENPPPDWDVVAAELGGRPSASERAPTAVKVLARPASPVPSPAEASRVPAAPPSADLQFVEMEQRVAQLMESALQVLRKQVEEIVRGALQDFEQSLEVLVKGAEIQVTQRADQAYEELESSLQTLRTDLANQLTALTDGVMNSAEEALRSKVMELFPSLFKPSPVGLPDKPTDPASRK